MARYASTAQRLRAPSPSQTHTHRRTPGMNLGGDKALIERDYHWWSKGLCMCVCTEPETRTGARGFLTPCGAGVATDSTGFWFKAAEEREGKRRFRGNPFVLLTLRPPELMGIELWYWVQSDRMGPLPSGTPHVLKHLGPGGGVLHRYALISDHKSSRSGVRIRELTEEDQ